MTSELIVIFVIFVICLIWFARLEIKFENLKLGKHYVLYEDNGIMHAGVMGIDKYGYLKTTIYGPSKMTYGQAKAIKSKYPGLIMLNEQTEEEVTE